MSDSSVVEKELNNIVNVAESEHCMFVSLKGRRVNDASKVVTFNMQITFEGIYRIMSAEGDNKYISTNIQGFNVIIEIDNIWIYGGGAHITVIGYDKANTPFECYISLMAQMM